MPGPDPLRALFRTRTIATMGNLKAALRKLRTLGYLSSYSHRGQFYTLAELARFDARGLFHRDAVHFSRFGSLLATAEHSWGRARPATLPPSSVANCRSRARRPC